MSCAVCTPSTAMIGSASTRMLNYCDSCTNGLGRLCGVSVNGGTSQSYGYDAAGRVVSSTQTTDGIPYSLGYTYDLAGELESTTLPTQRTVTQCYDRAGRVKSLTGTKSGELTRTYFSQASYD